MMWDHHLLDARTLLRIRGYPTKRLGRFIGTFVVKGPHPSPIFRLTSNHTHETSYRTRSRPEPAFQFIEERMQIDLAPSMDAHVRHEATEWLNNSIWYVGFG